MSPYRGRVFPGGLAPCPKPAEVKAQEVMLMVRWVSHSAEGWGWFSSSSSLARGVLWMRLKWV